MAVLELQIASAEDHIPAESQFKLWVEATLEHTQCGAEHEVSIRVVDTAESQALNFQYRGIDTPTNVLSFPCELPPGVDIPLLGDLAICAPVVGEEASAQEKPVVSHWAHMVIHGTLHLLGYDHQEDSDAEIMETIEIAILLKLGYSSPY